MECHNYYIHNSEIIVDIFYIYCTRRDLWIVVIFKAKRYIVGCGGGGGVAVRPTI